jgi:D-alanine-D-alanine ligase
MIPLSIGLVYETFETYPRRPGDPPDSHVEYEPESTIEALEHAIAHLGHRPVRLGSPLELRARLEESRLLPVDAVFNLSEGFGSRNREAWAPVLLEMAGVPVLGSDALTLSLTLDKAWANRWAQAGGIPVAPQTTLASVEAAKRAELPAPFPLFVKPRWEGTAKGIRRSSRVSSRAQLLAEVARIVTDYDQPALVEAFLPGAEYTVSLVGNDPPQVLPALQRAIELDSGIGVHALEGPGRPDPVAAFDHAPLGVLEPGLERRLAELSRSVFSLFECRDFARVDFRLNGEGDPIFLEINPLPTFATDGTFAILAELEGCSLAEMLSRCVSAGLARLGLGEAPGIDVAPGHGVGGVGGTRTRRRGR